MFPYTILSQLPEDTAWLTVLDLKDAVFWIPVHLDAQYLFAFEWTDPDTNVTQQYTSDCIPESLQLFGNDLAKELTELKLETGA